MLKDQRKGKNDLIRARLLIYFFIFYIISPLVLPMICFMRKIIIELTIFLYRNLCDMKQEGKLNPEQERKPLILWLKCIHIHGTCYVRELINPLIRFAGTRSRLHCISPKPSMDLLIFR